MDYITVGKLKKELEKYSDDIKILIQYEEYECSSDHIRYEDSVIIKPETEVVCHSSKYFSGYEYICVDDMNDKIKSDPPYHVFERKKFLVFKLMQ